MDKEKTMEKGTLAKIEWDADSDLYVVKVAATDGTNVEFVAGTQLLDDLKQQIDEKFKEMSA